GKQAQNFVQAYTLDQDELVLDSFDQIQSHHTQWFTFTQAEQERIQLARVRIDALTKWRTSIRSKCPQEIITNYDPILDQSLSVTSYERNLLALVNEFQQAFQNEDDEALVHFDKKLRGSPYQQTLTLTVQERERTLLAQDRTTALASFRLAIQ